MLLLIFFTLFWNVSYIAASGELSESGGNNANPHNLSSLSSGVSGKITSDDTTQICVFCHTPHGSRPQSTLWGRPNPTDMGNFPTYTSSIYDPSPTPNLGIDDPAIIGTTEYDAASADYPNGASKLCLSCHDGVTAIGTLLSGIEYSVDGAIGNRMIDTTSTKFFGNGGGLDLAASHPISFVYDSSVIAYLNSAAANKFYDFKLPTNITLERDSNNKTRVQCTVCHEPHLDTKVGGYTLPFWRMAGKGVDQADDYDKTCKECHLATYYNPGTPNFHNVP